MAMKPQLIDLLEAMKALGEDSIDALIVAARRH